MYLFRIRTDRAEFLLLVRQIPLRESPISVFRAYAGMSDKLRNLIGNEEIISIEKLEKTPEYLNYPRFNGKDYDSWDYYLYVNIPEDTRLAIISSTGTSIIYRGNSDMPQVKTILLDWW